VTSGAIIDGEPLHAMLPREPPFTLTAPGDRHRNKAGLALLFVLAAPVVWGHEAPFSQWLAVLAALMGLGFGIWNLVLAWRPPTLRVTDHGIVGTNPTSRDVELEWRHIARFRPVTITAPGGGTTTEMIGIDLTDAAFEEVPEQARPLANYRADAGLPSVVGYGVDTIALVNRLNELLEERTDAD
jgi:hypothetical protein